MCHHPSITIEIIFRFQPVYHNVNKSPTSWIKTHQITATGITPHRPNNFNYQNFNDYTFINLYLYYLHNFYRNYNFNSSGVMVTQLTTFVRLYS